MQTIQIDPERAQLDAPPARSPVDDREQKARFKAILDDRLDVREQGLFVNIALDGDEPDYYPLPRKNSNDDVRAWALGEYIERHGSAGKMTNYAAALAALWQAHRKTLFAAPDGESEREEKSEKRGRGRPKAQLSPEVQSALEIIRITAVPPEGAQYSASAPGSFYARVPFMPGNPEYSSLYTGTWLVTEKGATRLTDIALFPLTLTRPHSASKSVNFSGSLRAVNARGRELIVDYDRETLAQGLDAKFKGFAGLWPELPTRKFQLLEALNAALADDKVSTHDSHDSLGWVVLGGKLQWLASNGVETARGFIPSERAAIVAPEMKMGGNGYRADGEPRELQADIWELCLEKLNPEGTVRRLSKLGAWARLKFPEGTVDNPGVLDFIMETVGDGTGQGKSAEDNRLLSLDGLDFSWDKGTYLTEKDTAASRPRLMERVKYCLYTDYDRKARPGNKYKFEQQHASRRDIINQYADKTGGGMKMVDHGRKEANRGYPAGGVLLTGNYDHAQYSLTQPGQEEEAYEFRVCTFVLAPDEKASREISEQIEPRRGEIYAWGRDFRAWIMQQYNRDRAAFASRVQSWHTQAIKLESSLDCPWNHFRQQSMAIDLVWGLYAWAAFLEDTVEDYANHYLYKLIQENILEVLLDRLNRDDFLQGLVNKREGGVALGEFILQAMHNILGESRGYVVSQQDKLLTEDDVSPYSLSAFGYRHINNSEGEQWQSGGVKIGYYLSRRGAIAFKFDLLYSLLDLIAQREKYPLPPLKELQKKFVEAEIGSDAPAFIENKTRRGFITISLATLGIESREFIDPEEEEAREALADEPRAKIIDLTRRLPETPLPALPVSAAIAAQGERVPSGVQVIPSRSSDPFDIDPDDLRNFDPMA